MISTGFGVGFLDSRGRHPVYPYIVERRENDSVQRVCCKLACGSWSEVLMSSFVFVVRQGPVCDDLCGIVRVYQRSKRFA